MFKKYLLVFILASSLIAFNACSNKDDDKTEQKGDSAKVETKPTTTGQPDTNKANIGTGVYFNSITMSEFISLGAEVFFDFRTKSFDIYQLISYAPDPSKIWVDARFFTAWELHNFLEKGAKIIVYSRELLPFTINTLISEAKNPANVIVVCYNRTSNQTLEFIEKGATVIVGKPHDPFHIYSYIKAGKERVIVNAKGYTSNWIINFVEQGGSIKIDNSFNAFDVLTFTKVGKDKVTIMANGFNYKYVKMFVQEGAKIVIGRTWFTPDLYKSYDLEDIIKAAPTRNNVTVIGDYYLKSEIANFIELNAHILFIGKHYKEIDMIKLLNKQIPPNSINKSGR